MEAIAAATLITNLIWLILCEIQNPELRYDNKTILAAVILLAVYFITGYQMNAIIGAVVYCMIGLALGMILMPKRFIFVFQTILSSIRRK